eukprot:957585-Rhodomonas_salina.1
MQDKFFRLGWGEADAPGPFAPVHHRDCEDVCDILLCVFEFRHLPQAHFFSLVSSKSHYCVEHSRHPTTVLTAGNTRMKSPVDPSGWVAMLALYAAISVDDRMDARRFRDALLGRSELPTSADDNERGSGVGMVPVSPLSTNSAQPHAANLPLFSAVSTLRNPGEQTDRTRRSNQLDLPSSSPGASSGPGGSKGGDSHSTGCGCSPNNGSPLLQRSTQLTVAKFWPASPIFSDFSVVPQSAAAAQF